MKNKIKILILFVLLYFCSIQAQVTQEWVAIYGDGVITTNIANSIAVDNLGNVYVTGEGLSSDYMTIKYNFSGVQQWARRYNGLGNGTDVANSVVVDNSGNVYVTGYSLGKGTDYDYATIKYNSAGDSIWVRTYNGPVNDYDYANSMAVDGSGNVYVTGRVHYGSSTYYDYATIKYNSEGDLIWIRRFNGQGNSGDEARSIAIDISGNVYVTGYSTAPGANYDYATIKYNSAGDSIWVRRYNGQVNDNDYANSMAVDYSGNVFVTGYSWGGGTNYDYATVKYNSSGVQQWVQRYNGPGNRQDFANSISVDGLGNAFVTGVSYGNGTDSDYATIKYNSSGIQEWVQRYNGPGNGKDFARSMVLDGSGNAYVTGWSLGNGTYYDFATIKYSTVGIQEWVQRYNGNYHDGANAIAVDSSGNVYVTGNSMSGPPHFLYLYATIKYSPIVNIQPISNEIPDKFKLSQNYPNPFNPVTKIKFALPAPLLRQTGLPPSPQGEGLGVRVVIYDILGREVAELVNEQLSPGNYEVEWNADGFSSSVYYYKLIITDASTSLLKAGSTSFTETKKMILLR